MISYIMFSEPVRLTSHFLAGAYSSHFQLAYELNFPVTPVIKRISMHSNAMATQPKTVEESQLQFDQLLEHFGISLDLSGPDKLAKLREIPDYKLSAEILNLRLHSASTFLAESLKRSSLA